MKRRNNVILEKNKVYGYLSSDKGSLINLVCKDSTIVNGFNLRSSYRESLNKVSGYVEDNTLYEFLTMKENLRYFAYLYNIDYSRVKEVMDIMKLDISDKRIVKHLDINMKKRLGIGVSLLKKPNVLILDGVIDEVSIESLECVKDITIIIVSNSIKEIEKYTTDIIYINNNSVSLYKYKEYEYDLDKDIFSKDEVISNYSYVMGEDDSLEDSLLNLMGDK